MSSKARKDLKKLLNALLSILPSNNRITLFLSMLPMDMTTARELFPDIVNDHELLMTLKEIFKLDISNDKIECKECNTILCVGNFLHKLIDAILYNLSVRHSIKIAWSHILGKNVRDPLVELITTKLKLIKETSHWKSCYKILSFIAKQGKEYIKIDKENAPFQLGISPEEFEQAISILSKYGIVGYGDRSIYIYDQLKFYIHAEIAREYGVPNMLTILKQAIEEIK